MTRISIALLFALAVLEHVNSSVAKLAPEHSPKSFEMLSNNLYATSSSSSSSGSNNNNNVFDNELLSLNYMGEDELEHMENRANVVATDNNNNNSDSNTYTNNNKENNVNLEMSLTNQKHANTPTIKNNFVARKSAGEALEKAHNPSFKAVSIKSNTTAAVNAPAIPTKTATPTTTTAAGALVNTNGIATANGKIYQPNGFINPFGQLVAFFGSDQLHLQDYNFLFNAERHTVFHLHTAAMTSQPMAAAITSERVLNAVSGSIGAVFGVNTAAASAGAPSIKVEEVQLYNAASLRQSRYNPFNPTRILIHGWFGGSHAGIYQTLVPEYLKQGAGNYNIFTVDWGRGAIADYLTASYRVKPVGKVVAKFIDFLHREAGMNFNDLHVVGFSMGAHIAGIAGKHVQTGRLPVIYALDPALPFFRYEDIDERVALTDADYVEVIHTSSGSYGYDRPLGHVDFYVNYGSNQPGCFFNECSHFRAFQVYAESLASKAAFRGQGCDVKLWPDLTKNRRCLTHIGPNLTMGGDPLNAPALKRRGGVYYFSTNASPPFGKS